MKKLIFLLPIFISTVMMAQFNLVPNPDMESYINCPNLLGSIEDCAFLQNFGNSPDYYNSCSANGLNVPNAVFGFQYAHSGYGMAGLVTYRKPGLPGTPNAREFIGIQLSSPLQIGIKYFISFYANFSYYQSHPIATNKLGLRFSTIPFDSCCPPPINNFSHIYTDTILNDSVKWVKIQGSLIADSLYTYLCIANFFDDANTDTLICNINNYDLAYYYIDDVCVSVDSVYCQSWTGIDNENANSNNIVLFPNPVNEILSIKSNIEIIEIEIYNGLGILCYKNKNLKAVLYKMSTVKFPSGIYFILIKTKETTKKFKIQIIH